MLKYFYPLELFSKGAEMSPFTHDANRIVMQVFAFCRTLHATNSQLMRYRYRIYLEQYKSIARRYEYYGLQYSIDFSDLLKQLRELVSHESTFVLLPIGGVDYALLLRKWRSTVNAKLIERLQRADVRELRVRDEQELAEIAATCNYMQEQILKSSQMMGMALRGAAQMLLRGEIELAAKTVEGLTIMTETTGIRLQERMNH